MATSTSLERKRMKSSKKKRTLARAASVKVERETAKRVAEFVVRTAGDFKVPNITDSIFLKDSRLLLLDQENRKLKLFDSNFRFLSERILVLTPWDVATLSEREADLYPKRVAARDYDEMVLMSGQIDGFPRRMAVNEGSSEVAVAVSGRKIMRVSAKGAVWAGRNSKIMKVAISDEQMSRGDTEPFSMKPMADCRGLAYMDGNMLALTGGEDPGSLSLRRADGFELSRQTTDRAGNLLIDKYRARAYVSDWDGHTVRAIDLDTNKEVFTYKHKDLSGTRGMAVDKGGNVYVCGYWSHNIHKISSSGQHINIPLFQKDLPYRPRTISFTPNDNTLIVCGNSEIVAVYTKDKNKVR